MGIKNTKNGARESKRERMFYWQKGRCHWCHGEMTLDRTPPPPVRPGLRHNLPLNFATFDHLYSRLDPRRRDWKIHTRLGLPRIVLACWQCNHERAQDEIARLVDEQRRRSASGQAKAKGMPNEQKMA